MSGFSEEFVRAVGDGIREYNSRQPPAIIRIVDGVQLEPTPAEQADCDAHFYNAVRYGLARAVERTRS